MVAKFKDRPVRFISVTDEEKSVVERFLPAHPMSGWIGLDQKGATFRRYGIDGRPTVALIDAGGVLRNVSGSGDAITENSIEALLAGTLPVASQPKGVGPMGSEPNAPMPIFQTLIRPAMRDSGMGSGLERRIGGKWEGWGMPIRELLARSSGLPSSRVIAPDWCDGERFDITVPVGENEEAKRALVRQTIAAAFSLEIRRDTREIDVLILRKVAVAQHRLAEDPYGLPLRRLILATEFALKQPVFDETGLGGTYKFEYVRESALTSYAAGLKEQLGLELMPSRRSMEALGRGASAPLISGSRVTAHVARAPFQLKIDQCKSNGDDAHHKMNRLQWP